MVHGMKAQYIAGRIRRHGGKAVCAQERRQTGKTGGPARLADSNPNRPGKKANASQASCLCVRQGAQETGIRPV